MTATTSTKDGISSIKRSRSNIFICFAEEEHDFARELDEALRKRRRVSSINWEKTDAFGPGQWRDVLPQIERAETFIFIISPSSIASENCLRQLEHAAKLKKVIVPIVRIKVEESDLPSHLSSIPVIDYRAEVDFLKAFEAVIKAINTNLRIDVFICYAREDRDFVVRLYEELVKTGRNIWLDLSSIPTSTIWEQEIYSGIEASDNFIYVISPDSIQSDSFCHKELARAFEHNKRIVPLYHRDADPAQIPASLAQYQRRDFPAGGDFEGDFERLLADLDQNPDYLRQHTRLLTRAIEWQRSENNQSLLLRGTDLTHYETLLRTSAGIEPQFTNLQTQYVLASRESANLTRKKVMGAVVTALILTIILSVGLFFQTQAANAARQTAEEQRNEATTQKDLAERRRQEAEDAGAEAKRQQTIAEQQTVIARTKEQEAVDAKEAALQSAEAEREAREQAEERRREAERQRLRAEQQTLRAEQQTSISQARELVLSGEANIKKDAQLSLLLSIAAAEKSLAAEGKIDARTESILRRVVLAVVPRMLTGTDGIEDIAWHPDGKRLAAASSDGKVVIISVANQKIVDTFDTQGWVEQIDWNSDGNLLAVGTREQKVIIWDNVQKKKIDQLDFEDQVVSVSWRRNTKQIAVSLARGDGSVVKVIDWNKKSNKELFEVPGIRGDWSPDGNLLATGGGDGVVRIYSSDARLLATIEGHSRYVNRIAWTSDSGRFATASVDDKVIVWDAVNLKKLVTLNANFALGVGWSPDNSRLVCGSGSDVVTVWDGNTYALIFEYKDSQTITGDSIQGSGPQGYVLDVAWNPNGVTLAASERGDFESKGSIRLFPAQMFYSYDAGGLLAVAKILRTRSLTKAECKEFFRQDNCPKF